MEYSRLIRRFSGILLQLALLSAVVHPVQAAPPIAAQLLIETAPASGAAGYEIGIFGRGFGAAQGTGKVTIGGAAANVLDWRDQMIRVTIPPEADGKTELVIETGSARAVWPFEIYTINPAFTARVDDMQNIALGKPVYFTTPVENAYLGDSPSLKLSRNDAYWPGYLDCLSGQIFAVNLGQPMNEAVWWTMYGGTDGWPPFDESGRAAAYTIEGSNDSTDGIDGTWQVLHTVTDNKRTSIIHKVKLANHSWIRMKVNATLNNAPFRVYEIRVHKRIRGSSNNRVDSLGIIGDSLTYSDFNPLREEAFFPAILAQKRQTAAQIVYYPVGLVGAQASTLSVTNTEEWAFPQILAQIPGIDFWGFAFGTNDSLSIWDTQNYKQYVREGIEQVLALGKVPMIARLPDTGPEGFGTLENKIAILKAIDELNAEYRLIPGPDLYTLFRKNIMYEGMTYLNEDQTHHSEAGGLAVQQLWADALVRAGIYAAAAPAAPPPPAAGGDEGKPNSLPGSWHLRYRCHRPM